MIMPRCDIALFDCSPLYSARLTRDIHALNSKNAAATNVIPTRLRRGKTAFHRPQFFRYAQQEIKSGISRSGGRRRRAQ